MPAYEVPPFPVSLRRNQRVMQNHNPSSCLMTTTMKPKRMYSSSSPPSCVMKKETTAEQLRRIAPTMRSKDTNKEEEGFSFG
mmetsp:Transcript_19457/g.21751  ORF Transcript_19457/g.21751 Transcript_19457/m.21751 type:complete len:82 (-) Transcript_19457:58-303(-)